MSTAWNKGLTKEDDARVRKISETMRCRRIDNFRRWREQKKKEGKIPSSYPAFKRSGNLAEYIGVVLGDGNISRFPRTERIIISCNAAHSGFIRRYAALTKTLFGKEPTVSKIASVNGVRISLYQKSISKRLGVPSGARGHKVIQVPLWIWENSSYLKRWLRGLFEAEGSLSIHKPTSTYNLQFSNTNVSLLRAVAKSLRSLGYNPEVRLNSVRLRRKAEVEKFLRSVKFRAY